MGYRVWCLALVLSAPIFCQAPPAGSNSQPTVEQVFRLHEAWGPGGSSRGAALSLREISRNGQMFLYRMYAVGLPRGDRYSFFTWPITKPSASEEVKGVRLDPTGLVICPVTPVPCPSKPGEPIEFFVTVGKGVPVRVGLVSIEDSKLRAFAKIVPLPNQASNRGCALEAVQLAPQGQFVLVEGRGFPPNAQLAIDRLSGDQHTTAKAKATKDGRYFDLILPFQKGRASGTMAVKTEAAGCTPSLAFDWGARK
jgi:hypothetical protein